MPSHRDSYTQGRRLRRGAIGGLTRRDFTLRAGAFVGLLASGPLFGEALAVAAPEGPLDPGKRATLAALLEALPQPQQGTVEQALDRFERIYAGWDGPFRQAVNAVLDLLEAGSPDRPFSELPLAARRSFIAARTAVPRAFTDFGSERTFQAFVKSQANATRQAALLDLQAQLDQSVPGLVGRVPDGLGEFGSLLDKTGELLEPIANGPLLVLPDPRTGYIPDYDQEVGAQPVAPRDGPTPTVTLSGPERVALAVEQGIEFARLAFIGEPDDQPDEGIDQGEGEPSDGEPEAPDEPGDVPPPEEEEP